MSDEMKEVYGHYCRNHDDANAVLMKVRHFFAVKTD